MDKLTPEQRARAMRAVKSQGSLIERLLMEGLKSRGLEHFETNVPDVEGKPDILFRSQKVAVFCDSEFWHGKDWEQRKADHKSNQAFWHQKIERNRRRDQEVNEQLSLQGYTVLRFWGKDIKKNTESCLRSIEEVLNQAAPSQTAEPEVRYGVQPRFRFLEYLPKGASSFFGGILRGLGGEAASESEQPCDLFCARLPLKHFSSLRAVNKIVERLGALRPQRLILVCSPALLEREAGKILAALLYGLRRSLGYFVPLPALGSKYLVVVGFAEHTGVRSFVYNPNHLQETVELMVNG